ncbi:MAG: DUF2800 domain-containing protein [Eubacteriales bacterium]|nr:DUF2800 domain-containing protein [Eubacteriales bacterium]
MTTHAILSASSAHRWLVCTPSAQLEQQYPDSTSDYAKEGSLAHKICELKAGAKFLGAKGTKTALTKFKKNPLYQREMEGYTDQYVDYLAKTILGYDETPYVTLEKRLDYSAYVPEGFGTGDCIIIGGGTMRVIDFKYGKGVQVNAEGNPQMRLYALGAYEAYKMIYPIRTIRMSIMQPRIDNIQTAEISSEDLIRWAEDTVKPAAEKAIKGEGEFVSGDHCRFCRARAACKARAVFNMKIEPEIKKEPATLTPEEVGDLLTRSADVASWAKDLQEYALSQCLQGIKIPGWKVVEGRSIRKWTDQEAAFQAIIDKGLAPKRKLYERKPITLAACEKLLGRAEFAEEVGEFIEKPPGKPTLAKLDDKRPAITLKTTAAEAFGGKEE